MGTLIPNPPLAFSSRAKRQRRWQKPVFSCDIPAAVVPGGTASPGQPLSPHPTHPGVPEDTLTSGAGTSSWEEGRKFPRAGDPVGPGGVFWELHELLFPVEMPTDKGSLAGASSCWLVVTGIEAVCVGECLCHSVLQKPRVFLLLLP